MLQWRSGKGKIELVKSLFNIEKHDAKAVIRLCAGLPYDRGIPLSLDEKETLFVGSLRERGALIFWLLGIPVCLGVPMMLSVILNLTAADTGMVNDIVAVTALVLLVIGIPASLYFADRALRRFRVLNRTLAANHLRRFAGNISSEDWTNTAYAVMKRSGYLNEHENRETHIDLHAVDDIVFKIDNDKVERWISVELTEAARPPDSPARFKAPLEWTDFEKEDDILRRRLTGSESDEIRGYARKMRRRRWWQMLIVAWVAAILSRLIGIKIFELEFAAIFAIWAGVTIIPSALLFYRWTLDAELYDEDREGGWAIMLEPTQLSPISHGEKTLTQAVEVLPISGVVWTIGGNPAGWRRHSP